MILIYIIIIVIILSIIIFNSDDNILFSIVQYTGDLKYLDLIKYNPQFIFLNKNNEIYFDNITNIFNEKLNKWYIISNLNKSYIFIRTDSPYINLLYNNLFLKILKFNESYVTIVNVNYFNNEIFLINIDIVNDNNILNKDNYKVLLSILKYIKKNYYKKKVIISGNFGLCEQYIKHAINRCSLDLIYSYVGNILHNINIFIISKELCKKGINFGLKFNDESVNSNILYYANVKYKGIYKINYFKDNVSKNILNKLKVKNLITKELDEIGYDDVKIIEIYC